MSQGDLVLGVCDSMGGKHKPAEVADAVRVSQQAVCSHCNNEEPGEPYGFMEGKSTKTALLYDLLRATTTGSVSIV